MVFDDGSEARVARVLVLVQVGLLGVQALMRRRQDWPTPTGVRVVAGLAGAAGVAVMVGAGLSLGPGLTASPLPNARADLRTDGFYRRVRHPMYSGVILLSVARTVASGDARQAAVSIALGSLLYGKSRFEERALARRFPDYPAYAARTPRFVPRLLVVPDDVAAPLADSRDRRRRLSPRGSPRISSPENGIREGGPNTWTSKAPSSGGTVPHDREDPDRPADDRANKDENVRRHDSGRSIDGGRGSVPPWLGVTAPAACRVRGRGLALTAAGVEVKRSTAKSVHGLSSVIHHRLYRLGQVASVTRMRAMGFTPAAVDAGG